MIGHALAIGPGPPPGWPGTGRSRCGFAVGSLCFFIGPVPGLRGAGRRGADAVVFFAGSIFFTLAASARAARGDGRARAPLRRGSVLVERRRSSSWARCCSTSTPSTPCRRPVDDAAEPAGLSPRTCSARPASWSRALLAYRVAYRARAPRSRMAAVNLAGCVLFGDLGDRVYVVPVERVDARPGRRQLVHRARRACFFIGALMLLRLGHRTDLEVCTQTRPPTTTTEALRDAARRARARVRQPVSARARAGQPAAGARHALPWTRCG